MNPLNKKASELSVEELRVLLEKKELEEVTTKKITLEQEFLKAQKEATYLLSEKIKKLESLLGEAEETSERYGIPFDFNGYRYTPESYFEKFEGLDEHFVYEHADYPPDEYSGWHSSSSRC